MSAVRPSAKASKKVTYKYTIDASLPFKDSIFDLSAFEKFLHDKIKVNGRAGNLGEVISITKDEKAGKLTVTATQAFSKRYLKYLTRKFLKYHRLRDYLRIISSDKNTYELRYFNISPNEDEEDDE